MQVSMRSFFYWIVLLILLALILFAGFFYRPGDPLKQGMNRVPDGTNANSLSP